MCYVFLIWPKYSLNLKYKKIVTLNAICVCQVYITALNELKLAPEYAKAATTLKSDKSANDVRLAKVDATVESEFGERFKIKGYPIIKVFVDGQALAYSRWYCSMVETS